MTCPDGSDLSYAKLILATGARARRLQVPGLDSSERAIEPRLKAGGKYEMASVELHQGDAIDPKALHRLVREAVQLNAALGNPQLAAKIA